MRARGFAWSILLSVAAGLAAAACGEDGVTPKTCPPVPLYDVRTESNEDGTLKDPELQAQLEAAAEAGCITTAGTALSTPAPPPENNGGAGGSG